MTQAPEDVGPEVIRPEGTHDHGVGTSGVAETVAHTDSDSSDDTPESDIPPPAGMIRFRSQFILDPAAKLKRKVSEVDPDYKLVDENSSDDDLPFQSARRKRARAATAQLTIGDAPTSATPTTTTVPPQTQLIEPVSSPSEV